MTDNLTHKLGPPGYCKARHIREAEDYCNEPVVKGGGYCSAHTCVIPGCLAQEVAVYPLLAGEPRFCSVHHKPEFTEKYGADSGSIDLDPNEGFDFVEYGGYDDDELDFDEVEMDSGPAEL